MKAERRLRSAGHIRALRRLDIGEADLLASAELGAATHLAGLGLRQEDFTACFTFDDEPLYCGFGRETDDRLIHRLNRARQKIKAAGPQGLSRFDRMFADEAGRTIPREETKKESARPDGYETMEKGATGPLLHYSLSGDQFGSRYLSGL
jgi:hypothetical protein